MEPRASLSRIDRSRTRTVTGLGLLLIAAHACRSNGDGDNPPAPTHTHEEWMELGSEAYASGDWVEASRRYEEARKTNQSPEATHFLHLSRARLAEERDSLVEALEEVRLALAAAPSDEATEYRHRLESRLAVDAPTPRITIEDPPLGSVLETTPISIVGRIVPGEGATVKVSGEEVAVVDGVFRARTHLQPGENRIPIHGSRFGKEVEETLVVTLRSKGPRIEILSPADGAWVSTPEVQVEGRVSEPSAIVLVAGLRATVESDGRFRAVAPLASDGPNELVVEAEVEGGDAARFPLRVHRDTSPPLVRIVEPAAGTLVTEESVRVVVEVSDNGKIASVRIAEREATLEGTRATLDVPLTTDWATIRVSATDGAGHESSSEVFVLKNPVPRGWTALGRNDAGSFEVESPKDGSVFVFVGPGPFDRGSDDGDENEQPRRRVELSGYLISKTPVTWAQYARYASETGRPLPSKPAWAQDDHPVVGVTWLEAAEYAQWAGCRLPTEAQWEKAAGWDAASERARNYPWGDGPAAEGGTYRANFSPTPPDADGFAQTAPVEAFAAGLSPYGAQQMAGNVWQWCQDWYDPQYYMAARDQDPLGPESGVERVIRGGSWDSESEMELRVAARRGASPGTSSDNMGFRLAKPLSEF